MAFTRERKSDLAVVVLHLAGAAKHGANETNNDVNRKAARLRFFAFGVLFSLWVAQGRRAAVVRFLLDHGAKLDGMDDCGKTPLDAARGNGGGRGGNPSEEIVALLEMQLRKATGGHGCN